MGVARAAFGVRMEREVKRLEESWQQLQQEWNKADLEKLHQAVYHLYRLSELNDCTPFSLALRNLEVYLYLLQRSESLPTKNQRLDVQASLTALKHAIITLAPPVEDNIHQLSLHMNRESFFQKMLARKLAFRWPELNCSSPNSGWLPGQSIEQPRMVAVIDNATEQLIDLELQLAPYGYVVKRFNDLAGLKAFFDRKSFQPQALIIPLEIYLADTSLIDFIATLTLGDSNLPPIPILFISEHDSALSRLQAVKAGGEAFFNLPINLQELVERLDILTTPAIPQAYRVLIVEDSPTTAAFYATTLQMAGMLTVIVNDPLQIMQPLAEFNPELILLDMYMPNCSGLEVAAMIRQQATYVGVPIVFLSAETNLNTQLQALQLGGDDFLTKPIHSDHLISLIRARIERARVLRSFMERDSLTGLLNHSSFKEQLEVELARAKRYHTPLALAMLDLDYFKQINDCYGHPIGDQVIKNLTRILKFRLRRTDVIGRYGGEEFGVILADANGPNGQKALNEIRGKFSQLRHRAGEKEFSCSFSCGIATYPAYGNGTELLVAADQALYKAKQLGRNQVILASI